MMISLELQRIFYRNLLTEDSDWTPNIDLSVLYQPQSDQLLPLANPFTWEEIQKLFRMHPITEALDQMDLPMNFTRNMLQS